jgi:hypothetical protein
MLDVADTPLRTSSAAVEFKAGALHRAGLEDALYLLCGGHHGDSHVDVVGQRYFAIDNLAGGHRGDREKRHANVVRGDADEVDVLRAIPHGSR